VKVIDPERDQKEVEKEKKDLICLLDYYDLDYLKFDPFFSHLSRSNHIYNLGKFPPILLHL
jgi:hypothetical protein